jgi:hypothetical protein
MAEKGKRIEWRDFKKLRSKSKQAVEDQEKFAEWKEDICARDDVNCEPHDLRENQGTLIIVDSKGGVKAVPEEVKPLWKEQYKHLKDQDRKWKNFVDELERRYYPAVVNLKDGTLTEYSEVHPKDEKDEEEADEPGPASD